MKENKEIRSSAHSKYRCQYHIVFAPKFRRKEIANCNSKLKQN
jgi:REP element-mobilizing transposase RayT